MVRRDLRSPVERRPKALYDVESELNFFALKATDLSDDARLVLRMYLRPDESYCTAMIHAFILPLRIECKRSAESDARLVSLELFCHITYKKPRERE